MWFKNKNQKEDKKQDNPQKLEKQQKDKQEKPKAKASYRVVYDSVEKVWHLNLILHKKDGKFQKKS